MQESQFNSPYGCALGEAGNIYLPDRDNGMVPKLSFSSDRVSTYLSGWISPAGAVTIVKP